MFVLLSFSWRGHKHSTHNCSLHYRKCARVDKLTVCRSIFNFFFVCLFIRARKKYTAFQLSQFVLGLFLNYYFFLIIFSFFCMKREELLILFVYVCVCVSVCVCVCETWTCGKKPANFLLSHLPALLLSFLLCIRLALFSVSVGLNHWLTDHPTRNEGQFLPLQCCYCYY